MLEITNADHTQKRQLFSIYKYINTLFTFHFEQKNAI